jgi:hypothetical protein
MSVAFTVEDLYGIVVDKFTAGFLSDLCGKEEIRC